MKLSLVMCLACLATGMGSYLSRRAAYNPYRPSRWVPRAFWNPEKRGGIGSLGGLRSYLASRPTRGGGHVYHVGQLMGKRGDQLEDYTEEENPFLYDTYQDLEELKDKRRSYGSKYADNKSYGFWISALNKAGNIKRSPHDLAEEIPKIEESGMEPAY